MTAFFRTLFWGVFCLQAMSQLTSVFAQGVNANADLLNASQMQLILKQFASDQQKLLSNITSFTFEANCTFQITPDFAKTLFPNYSDPTVKIKYAASGKKFIYDVEDSSKTGIYASEKYGFDGEHYQQLLKRSGVLFISSKIKESDSILVNKQYLFDPFIFVPQERLQKPFTSLTLQQFASSDNWNSLASRVKKINITSDQTNKLLTFEIPGGTDVVSNKLVTFKVVCDEKLLGYPIKWSMVDNAGKIVCEYTITNLAPITDKASGMTFYYPKTAEMKRYVNEKLASTAYITISSIGFNNPIDDDQFAIDPTQANVIVDVDNHTRVEVPK
jgi:hypothetical protein